jgi:glutaredoxin
MGYGSIEDKPALLVEKLDVQVTLYTGLGCPFCPAVKERLIKLSSRMGFQVREVDVTLKPGLLLAKGIRALPVVEVGDKRLTGNLTSEQLARFIEGIK